MAVSTKEMLNSGSTLLNLACTGRPFGCFIKGKYYFFVGDSTSGKTWLALNCFAEACLNKRFDDYRLIHDNAEDGALMDLEEFFGSAVAERIEPPAGTKDDPQFSETIEEFYYNVDDAIQAGTPFIYVLDSMDALSSEDEQDKFDENKKAHRKGKEAKGSYGDGKAKKNAANLRRILSGIKKTGSILIIINQTRDNINAGPFQDSKTRSGGHALKFYATLEMWTSIKGTIKKKIKEKDRELGIYSQVKIKKNRVNGRKRTVVIPIYHSYGIDDIGSCVDYLVEEGHWKKGQGGINAIDFDFKGVREKLIKHIEEQELERELRVLVGKVWDEIEEACTVKRKRRYE